MDEHGVVITLHQVLGMLSVAVVLIVVPGPSVLIVVPGPSVLFVTSRAVALGRKAGIATALGNATGVLTQG